MIRRWHRDPAATCRREAELRCDAHHEFCLPVCDRKIRRLHGITTGTVHNSSLRAAASRPWPAMTSPPSPTRIGFEKPNARILPAVSAICAALWVRALRAYPPTITPSFPTDAAPREQSPVSSLNYRDEKSCLNVVPIPSSAQSTWSLVITSGGAMRSVCPWVSLARMPLLCSASQ